MANWGSVDGRWRLRKIPLNFLKSPNGGRVPQVPPRELFKRLKEHLTINMVSIILVSAFLQHIFREPLLACLKRMLEAS